MTKELINKEVAKHYAKYVKSTGMKQLDLAKLLHVNPVTLSRRCTGKYPITAEAFALMYMVGTYEEALGDIKAALALYEISDSLITSAEPKPESPMKRAQRLQEELDAGMHPGKKLANIQDTPEWELVDIISPKESAYDSSMRAEKVKAARSRVVKPVDNSSIYEDVSHLNLGRL